jgi:hypothetical protein
VVFKSFVAMFIMAVIVSAIQLAKTAGLCDSFVYTRAIVVWAFFDSDERKTWGIF